MNAQYAFLTFIVGTLILMLFAFTLTIFLIVHKKKRYQHLLEKQQMENNYQNQLLQTQLEVQEQSFKYFSEEIHDNVGQLLSLVKLQLYNIRNSSQEPHIVKNANESTEILGQAITDLRNISHTLNSSYIAKAGLAEAIEKELAYICSAKKINCHLHRSGEEYGLGNERELLVFRVIQEAMANSLKHASPATIDISLSYTPEALLVKICDDGSGFDTTKKSTGIGLDNMNLRAGILGGELQVQSVAGQGTTIYFEVRNNHTVAA